jgi:hypothetical protein
MMDKAALRMFRPAFDQLFECLGKPLPIDMHIGAAGGEQLGFPGRRIRPAGNDDRPAFERPEDRELRKRRHAGAAIRRCFIPQLLQDIHR